MPGVEGFFQVGGSEGIEGSVDCLDAALECLGDLVAGGDSAFFGFDLGEPCVEVFDSGDLLICDHLGEATEVESGMSGDPDG